MVIETSLLPHWIEYNASGGVAVLDQAGRFQALGGVIANLFGSTRAEIIGTRGETLFSPEFLQERGELVQWVVENRRPLVLVETVRGWRTRTVLEPLDHPDRPGETLIMLYWGPEATMVAGQNGVPRDCRVVIAQHNDGDAIADLTPTERRILKLVGAGFSSTEIAAKLHRSVKTIEWHRSALGRKLKVDNRVELARIAIKAGLCPLTADAQTILSEELDAGGKPTRAM